MIKLKKNILFAFLLTFLSTTFLHAQCAKFTKKTCSPELSPYVSNGQVHTTILKDESKALVHLSLSKGLDYRIVICKSEDQALLEYKLVNKQGNIFSASEYSDQVEELNVSVAETSTYDLQLSLKNKNAAKNQNSSCVSVLVGFK